MYYDLDLLGRKIEQPSRLDHLEAFVHHRGRVDRDLRPHVPIGMTERLLLRDCRQLIRRFRAERTSGSRQPYFFHRIVPRSGEALEDGRMFGIDRKDRGILLFGQCRDQFARDNEGLLVGQCNC